MTLDKKLDNDDPEHIQWLYEQALQRAREFNISGVTYSLTQGVVKNIIPAIASTNAIIAASCCNEAFKIATSANPYLNNYMMYTGEESVYTHTFEHEKKEGCPVCGNLAMDWHISPEWTLEEFIQKLKEKPEVYDALPPSHPPSVRVETYYQSTGKSKSPRSSRRGGSFTTKPRRTSKPRRDRIWKRRCES